MGKAACFQMFENRAGWSTPSQHYVSAIHMEKLTLSVDVPENVRNNMRGVMSNSFVTEYAQTTRSIQIDQKSTVIGSTSSTSRESTPVSNGSRSDDEPLIRSAVPTTNESRTSRALRRRASADLTSNQSRKRQRTAVPISSQRSQPHKSPSQSTSRNAFSHFIAYRPKPASPSSTDSNDNSDLRRLFDLE